MTDVQLNLDAVGKTALVVDSASKQVKAKQELLSLLIASEQTRLSVWLHPLENTKKHTFLSGHGKAGLLDVSFPSRVDKTVLMSLDCRQRPLEDGLGREPRDCRASR